MKKTSTDDIMRKVERDLFISVLIPVYNVEPYVGLCIDSVLAQEKEVPFEIILVDDGSTDASSRICDDYKFKYPDIINVVHKKNEGLISARRTALQYANGEYIVWVDSDDTISPGFFTCIKKISDAYQSDMIIFGDHNRINQTGKPLTHKKRKFFTDGIIDKKSIFGKLISSSDFNSMVKKVCKRCMYDVDSDYSNYYTIQNGEDLIQSMPLFYSCSTFYYLNSSFYNYRINPSSLSRKYQPCQYKTLKFVRSIVYDYMVKSGFDSDEFLMRFFVFMLDDIWENLLRYVTANRKIIDYSVFEEIIGYSIVNKSGTYLKSATISKFKKRGLSLFFKHDWKGVEHYFKRTGFFIVCVRKMKMFVANMIL